MRLFLRNYFGALFPTVLVCTLVFGSGWMHKFIETNVVPYDQFKSIISPSRYSNQVDYVRTNDPDLFYFVGGFINRHSLVVKMTNCDHIQHVMIPEQDYQLVEHAVLERGIETIAVN